MARGYSAANGNWPRPANDVVLVGPIEVHVLGSVLALTGGDGVVVHMTMSEAQALARLLLQFAEREEAKLSPARLVFVRDDGRG